MLTIAAPLRHLAGSVYSACRESYRQIDLGEQVGVHPRLGAVDLLPIYPLSGDVTVEECGVLAKGTFVCPRVVDLESSDSVAGREPSRIRSYRL